MKTLGIIGSNGTLGSDLVTYLSDHFSVIPISKDTYHHQAGKKFNVLINANGNSKRFWANQHVIDDFELSTVSVYKSLFDFSYDQYIYVSSSDVYESHGNVQNTKEMQKQKITNLSPYGFHKHLSEQIIINNVKNYLILRCSMILGNRLKKGAIFDIVNNKNLYVTQDSYLQMITTKEVSSIILFLINSNKKNQVYNIGGSGVVHFSEIQEYFSNKIVFSQDAEKQEYEMNINKIKKIYPIKTSKSYLRDYVTSQNKYEKNI